MPSRRGLLLLLPLFLLPLHAGEPEAMPAFIQTITEAARQRDLPTIRQYFCETDTTPEIIARSSAAWEQVLSGKYPAEAWHFVGCTFLPLEQLQSPPPAPPDDPQALSDTAREAIKRADQQRREIVDNMTRPVLLEGHLYEYNLPVIGFLVLHFKNGTNETGHMMPIAFTPDGDIRFPLLKTATTTP